MTVQTLDDVRELAQQLRVDSIRSSTAAGSGHPTSSMSAADLMAVLLARHLRCDWQRPERVGIWTSCHTASGCCAVTARWQRDRCGRPWTTPPTTGWTA